MTERHWEEEIKIKAGQGKKIARYMSSTADLVENQIEKAMARGDFENLPGAGKPINFGAYNPYEDPTMRMGLKILKDNEFVPYWIELGKEIDSELERIQKDISYFKALTTQTLSERVSERKRERFHKRKDLFYFEIRQSLNKIEKKILDFNLRCPTFRLGRANIDPETEIAKIIADIEAFIEKRRQ
ncbi:MAG: DUF1992 domain-containing protein [Syntrophomonadaceae bacterium]|jgi:hypothetical protein|nr:DUF1992 domain-containing protein [Syntrophomonadaceae bacterium]